MLNEFELNCESSDNYKKRVLMIEEHMFSTYDYKQLMTYSFIVAASMKEGLNLLMNANKFLELVKKAKLENQCKSISFLTLSKDISTILKTSGFNKVKNAHQPNQASLLKTLIKIDM